MRVQEIGREERDDRVGPRRQWQRRKERKYKEGVDCGVGCGAGLQSYAQMGSPARGCCCAAA